MGSYKDDTSRILIEGGLPGNEKSPHDDINWHSVTEYKLYDHKDIPTESFRQDVVKDGTFIP